MNSLGICFCVVPPPCWFLFFYEDLDLISHIYKLELHFYRHSKKFPKNNENLRAFSNIREKKCLKTEFQTKNKISSLSNFHITHKLGKTPTLFFLLVFSLIILCPKQNPKPTDLIGNTTGGC